MINIQPNNDENNFANGLLMKVLPRMPKQLFAELLIGGEIRLSWSRNGNPFLTDYKVEIQIGNSFKWFEVARVQNPSFLYCGHRQGVTVRFRVSAVIGENESEPSNITEINFGFQRNIDA